MNLSRAVGGYRRAEELRASAREILHDTIRRAHAEGRTLRGIAEETGFSFARIGQIVRGEK